MLDLVRQELATAAKLVVVKVHDQARGGEIERGDAVMASAPATVN